MAEQQQDTQGKALSLQSLGLIYYTKTDFDQAQAYHRRALQLFQSIGDRPNLAWQLRNLGLVEVNFSQYDRALGHYTQALQVFQELRQDAGVADCYGNIAIVYSFLGDYQKAIQYSFASLKYREKVRDMAKVGQSYNSIGFLYTKLHKYVYARNYLEKSLQIADQRGDRVSHVFPLVNLGEVYRVWGDDARAVAYLNKAVKLSEEIHHQSGLFQSYDKLGLIARKHGELDKALQYQLKALQISDSLQNKEGSSTISNHIGQVYFDKGSYRKALEYHQKSLLIAREIKSKPTIKECYLFLAKTNYRLGNFEESAHGYQLYQDTQDTLFNDLTERVVAEIQQQYEAEKKASELKMLRQEKELQRLALAKGQNFRNSLLFAMCLGAIILGLAIYLYLSKSRSNRILKHMNERLSESEANLQQLNATKDKLFSIISHDLRGPLSTFSGFLQIRADYPSTFTEEETQDFIRKMSNSVKNLSELLNNLLQWSLSQMGHVSFTPERLPLDAFVKNNIRLLEESAVTKGVSLVAQVEQGTTVTADRHMLDLVLRNLLNNAVKFSREGDTVCVKAQLLTDFAEISVADTGIGIPAERLRGLFATQPTHSTRGTANERGTGLGLLLCREFIEQCGGTIQAISEENKGTTFTFTLPN